MPIMKGIAEVAGARRSRSLEEPAFPSPDFNFARFDARNAVLVDNTNWLPGGQLDAVPSGFAGSSINSQLPLHDAELSFQDSPVASEYSPIQQGSGGALAEGDSYNWDDWLTTIDPSLVGTGSIFDFHHFVSTLDPFYVSNPAPTPASTPALTSGAPTPVTFGAPTPQSQASGRGGLSPLAIGRNPNPSRQISLSHKTHSF